MIWPCQFTEEEDPGSLDETGYAMGRWQRRRNSPFRGLKERDSGEEGGRVGMGRDEGESINRDIY